MPSYLQAQTGRIKEYMQRFLLIVGESAKKKLIFLVGGFLFLSLIDLVGLSLIGPFVALATNPSDLSIIPGITILGNALGISSELNLFFLLGVVIFLIFLSKAIAGFLVNRAVIAFAMNHQRQTKTKLLEAYLSLPFERALEKNSSSLLTVINQHVSIFTNRTMIPILSSASAAIYFLALFLFLLITNPVVTLSLGGMFLVILLVYDALFKRRTQIAGEDSLTAFNATTKTIAQSADGFKEIRVAGAESYFVERLNRYSTLFADATTYMKSLSVVPRFAVETSVVGFVIGLLVIGLFKHGGTSPELISTVGMFGFAAIRAMPSVNTLLTSASNLRFGYAALLDLNNDLQNAESKGLANMGQESTAERLDRSQRLMPFEKKICVEAVSYVYPEKVRPALSELSLCLNKGQTIGVIGASGSGKTTLIDTLLGLLKPQSGHVTVDGRDIFEDTRAWMNRIAYIPQSVFLLDDTIRANIGFGIDDTSEIDHERVARTVEMAQLTTFIETLPKGLDTVVGERGTRLSGGQKQRVAIARALYNKRELLVMDEATAALDNATENDVVEAIGMLHGKVTTIVVAHRLSTLKYCDIIYQLVDGKIVKTGSYDDIVAGAS